MTGITEEEIVAVHSIVCSYFGQEPHIKDRGAIKSIAERPDTVLFGTYQPYGDVFAKAAAIMEAILRWHPFIDGNKRTALMAATAYLHNNGYTLGTPPSVVDFVLKAAGSKDNDAESTERLIESIASWLKSMSTKA